MHPRNLWILASVVLLFSGVATRAQTEQPQDVIAAQVRIQGFPCDRAQSAIRDKKRSKPDYAVWVLKCSNATYRVSRAPDMLAKVEKLK